MTSRQLYERARRVMPGGVNSSTRLNRALDRPVYLARGAGGRVWDVDGNELVDFNCAHGAALLGHAHPAIEQAVARASEVGFLCSAETEYQAELAEAVCDAVPCADRVRFCSSGSEATLHMIRACRGYTGRDKIIRIEGHFHGYHELIYIGGQPPADQFARNRQQPYIESPGIPAGFAQYILPVPFNDVAALEQTIEAHGAQCAMLIMEPICYNCGCLQPDPGYLQRVRELTRDAGIVLVFDEVQSSFKKSLGGAQVDLGVVPDACTMGKSLGGGTPLSAFAGNADLMEIYKPNGPVEHSGTFNAHLLPVLAGLAFIGEAKRPAFYQRLRELEERFHRGLERIVADHDLYLVAPHHGARFNVVLGTRQAPRRYEDTFCHDRALWLSIIAGCIEAGLYLHDYGGGPLHHGYSIQHTDADIDRALEIFETVLVAHRDRLSAPAAAATPA